MTERILSVSTIIFAAFFLVLSLQIENRANSLIGPGTWPAALMAMMLVLGILLTINVFRKKKEEAPAAVTDTIPGDEDVMAEYEDEMLYPKKFYYMLGLLVVYIVGLYFIGFILSTVILIAVAALLFGMKKWVNALVTAVVSTAGFIVLFPILLNLPFPRGIGIFRDISQLFY